MQEHVKRVLDKKSLSLTPSKLNKKKIDKFKGLGTLTIKTRNNNIFLTLHDSTGKTEYSCSGGFGRDSKRKSKADKMSPIALLNITRLVIQKCKIKKIKRLKILSKTSLRYILFIIFNELRFLGITLFAIRSGITFKHNGLRLKKLRRI